MDRAFHSFICLTCRLSPLGFIVPDTICSLIGGRTNSDSDAATAIVVYKPGSHSTPPVQNETAAQEENSKYLYISIFYSIMFYYSSHFLANTQPT